MAAVGCSDVKDIYISFLVMILFFTLQVNKIKSPLFFETHCLSFVLCYSLLRFLSQASKLYDSSLIASVNYVLSTLFAVVAGELWDYLLQVVFNRVD